MKDYQQTIAINTPVKEVYTAITQHIAHWWSNDLSGAAAKPGDRFHIAFNKTNKTFEIAEAIPNERIVWKCVQAHIDMASLTNKSEWVGTHLIWTMSPADTGSILTFLHEGLNQSFECYTVCESGWNTYLASLLDYLNTGKGRPFRKPVESGNPESQKKAVQ